MNQRINETLFSVLSRNIAILIEEAGKKNPSLLATDQWTVKDVLAHIVSWHEYYAANYAALAAGKEPVLREGPFQIMNHEGVLSLKKLSVARLENRLQAAQESLRESILGKEVPRMTYKKGGRIYETPAFLDMIARHVATHTKQVRRAK